MCIILLDSFQDGVTNCPRHQRRDRIPHQRVLGDFRLALVSAGLTLPLEYKSIVKRLEPSHFANRHCSILRIVDEIIRHRHNGRTLPLRIKDCIIALVGVQILFLQFCLAGVIIVSVLGDDFKAALDLFTLEARLVVELFVFHLSLIVPEVI